MADKSNQEPFNFTFGKNDGKPTPSFSFNAQSQAGSKPSLFSFGSASKEDGSQKPSGFGFKASSFKAPAKSVTTNSPTHGFNFGSLAASANSTSNSNQPPFKFGSVTSSSEIQPKSSQAFGFGVDKQEPNTQEAKSINSIKENPTSEETMKNGTKDENTKKQKEKENDFLKNYQAPSVEPFIRDDDTELAVDDDKDEEFYDMEIDKKTSLPIRRLNYEEIAKSRLGKGEHIKFAISSKTEEGMLFVTESEDKGTEKNRSEGNSEKGKTELFPFELIPQLDQSSEYRMFLNNLYKEFEPLLKNRKYKHYLEPENDEYMQIGVVSTIKHNREERQLFLRKLMSFTLSYLQTLIKEKMNSDFGNFSDQWVVNYEEIISVLYLLNALHFGNEDESIVLFQQWIERIDIQPDDELLASVFQDSDKPYQNTAFWSVYVKKLLLRCSFSQLVNDLKVSQYEELQDSDNELFLLIEDLISLIESYDPVLFSSDVSAFLRWKKVAVELREAANNVYAKNVMIHSELLELLSILAGSSQTIDDSSSSWYECFLGHFLYQMPSKKLIPEYIENALQIDTYEKPLGGIESWDSICVELFRGKYLTVIASLEALDKSIGTFVAVLVEAAGLLDRYSKDIDADEMIDKTIASRGISSNIDRMVEDLALTYLNSQEFFAIGVGILVSVGSSKSREILSEMLPTYEIKDSDDFEWVLSICSRLKLTQTLRTIQQMQGQRFYEKQLIPNALSCFAESSLPDKVVSTVWRLFEDALLNGGLDAGLAAQLFDSDLSKGNTILRQSLSPLYALHQVLRQDGPDDHVRWFRRLHALLEFAYLPGRYKCGLLLLIFDNLNKGIFDMANLVALIESINGYEKDLHRDAELLYKSTSFYTLLVDSRPPTAAYPRTLAELLFSVRRGIAMDVSFTFLDNTIY